LVGSEIYKEARRFLGTTTNFCNDNLEEADFLKNKYAVVIDLRTVNDENTVYSGGKLVGTQSGVILQIQKSATRVDLLCRVFVVADANIVISGSRLQKSEY